MVRSRDPKHVWSIPHRRVLWFISLNKLPMPKQSIHNRTANTGNSRVCVCVSTLSSMTYDKSRTTHTARPRESRSRAERYGKARKPYLPGTELSRPRGEKTSPRVLYGFTHHSTQGSDKRRITPRSGHAYELRIRLRAYGHYCTVKPYGTRLQRWPQGVPPAIPSCARPLP